MFIIYLIDKLGLLCYFILILLAFAFIIRIINGICSAIYWRVKGEQYTFKEWLFEFVDLYKGYGKKLTIFLIIASILTIITNSAIQAIFNDNIELKPEGTYCYYIEGTVNEGETYTLPAKIVKIKNEYDDSDSYITYSYSNYYINAIYFPNGKYVSFSDKEIYLDTKTSCFDNYDNEWDIMLLNEHAYSKYVEESSYIDWKEILILAFTLFTVAFIIFGNFLYQKENSQKN